jgi:hypothetical protein
MATAPGDDLRRILRGLFFWGPSWLNWIVLVLLAMVLAWLLIWGPDQMW